MRLEINRREYNRSHRLMTKKGLLFPIGSNHGPVLNSGLSQSSSCSHLEWHRSRSTDIMLVSTCLQYGRERWKPLFTPAFVSADLPLLSQTALDVEKILSLQGCKATVRLAVKDNFLKYFPQLNQDNFRFSLGRMFKCHISVL